METTFKYFLFSAAATLLTMTSCKKQEDPPQSMPATGTYYGYSTYYGPGVLIAISTDTTEQYYIIIEGYIGAGVSHVRAEVKNGNALTIHPQIFLTGPNFPEDNSGTPATLVKTYGTGSFKIENDTSLEFLIHYMVKYNDMDEFEYCCGDSISVGM